MAKNHTGAMVFTMFLVFTVLFPVSGLPQSKRDLVGTWKLVSATETTKKGEVRDALGWKNPIGLLTYTADGRVSMKERAEAFATMDSYAGRYTLDGNRVTHHIEVCSIPNLVNTDLELVS